MRAPLLALIIGACPAFGQFTACDSERSEELARRASIAFMSGDPAGSTILYREALSACPERLDVELELARALTASRKFDEAISLAEAFTKRSPRSVPGLMVLANALFMAGRWQDCAGAVDRILKIEPANASALLIYANNQYILGNNNAAEQALLAVLDKHPNHTEASYSLGRMYYMDNRADFALGQFERVLRLDPKHYKAWDNAALCYEALGETDRAIQYFLTAIKLVETDKPEYDWPYANLASLLLRLGRFEESYQAATKAAKRNPWSARNFYLGGQALLKLGRQADAARWFERSTSLDSEYPEPLYALGQMYARAGDKVKADATLNRFREVKARAPRKRR